MSLIYPPDPGNSRYGDLVAELTALGGVENVDFRFAHDNTSNVVAEVTEELYDAWRTLNPLSPSEQPDGPETGGQETGGENGGTGAENGDGNPETPPPVVQVELPPVEQPEQPTEQPADETSGDTPSPSGKKTRK
jgi:hypothetical protein